MTPAAFPTTAASRDQVRIRSEMAPGESAIECRCHSYQQVEAINAIAPQRPPMEQPQLSLGCLDEVRA